MGHVDAKFSKENQMLDITTPAIIQWIQLGPLKASLNSDLISDLSKNGDEDEKVTGYDTEVINDTDMGMA
jgi:hypothetical protein